MFRLVSRSRLWHRQGAQKHRYRMVGQRQSVGVSVSAATCPLLARHPPPTFHSSSSSVTTTGSSIPSSVMMSTHSATQPSQMKTPPGPAMSFFACSWSFPQNEHAGAATNHSLAPFWPKRYQAFDLRCAHPVRAVPDRGPAQGRRSGEVAQNRGYVRPSSVRRGSSWTDGLITADRPGSPSLSNIVRLRSPTDRWQIAHHRQRRAVP